MPLNHRALLWQSKRPAVVMYGSENFAIVLLVEYINKRKKLSCAIYLAGCLMDLHFYDSFQCQFVRRKFDKV